MAATGKNGFFRCRADAKSGSGSGRRWQPSPAPSLHRSGGAAVPSSAQTGPLRPPARRQRGTSPHLGSLLLGFPSLPPCCAAHSPWRGRAWQHSSPWPASTCPVLATQATGPHGWVQLRQRSSRDVGLASCEDFQQ